MKMKKRMKLHSSLYGLAIKQGLSLAIPFLLIGSFALLLNTFPWEAYQNMIQGVLDGKLVEFFTVIYNITLGSLALILIFTISISIGKLFGKEDLNFYPAIAICSYLAFIGGLQNQKEHIFGAEWVFTAMFITVLSCAMFRQGMNFYNKFEKLHTIGADYIFNQAMRSLLPSVVIIILFTALGIGLRVLMGDGNIMNFGSCLFLQLFEKIGGNILGVILYIFFSHLLWFFGIHGTNTLDAVAKRLFERGIDVNQALIASGGQPTEIFSKTFLDVFVFIGGCGTALCLIIALFIVAKKSHNKRLAQFSCVPVLFNISEIVVFGFPVIFNPIMIIPFILTPIVMAVISSIVMGLGFVPLVTHSVEWTSPVLLSGYTATGSVAGSILQLVNIAVGVFIYIPFVKRSEKRQTEDFTNEVLMIQKDMQVGEEKGRIPGFLSNSYEYNYAAKTLAVDLNNAMKRSHLKLFYQVQVQRDGAVYGGEALLRWKHPVAGYISPPLLISLAAQSGFLSSLGYYIIEEACRNIEEIQKVYEKPIHISVNLSPHQLEEEDFVEKVREIVGKYTLGNVILVFEITERALFSTTAVMINRIEQLRAMGIQISMDDFGMGHSSLTYLQENVFEEVKLDGSLVKQLMNNKRSENIVLGIIQMAKSLHFKVVAEFVETEEQRDVLARLGCNIYQGYLYGKAEQLEVFLEYLQSTNG